MSQAGVLTVDTSGGSVVETLTGNSGGAVGPDGSHNINILGNNSTGINIVGSPGTNTLSVVGIQATTLQRGTVFLATDAQAIAGTDTVNALTSSNLAAKLGTQTAHSLAVFEGSSSALTALGVATNGQIPIGSVGADPVLGNITSSGGTITVTNGPGTINIDVAAGTHVVETLTGNSGGAIAPTAGNINTLGTGSITIAGAGSTLTTQLTGLTNHALQIGAGTATLTQLGPGSTGQVLQTNSSADPTWSTATYPSTTTINQLLYSSATNVVAGLATANRGVLTTGTTGIPVITALATDGQVIIGSTAGVPAAATLTAGTGISITNASNSITIAVSGSAVLETLTGNSGGALSPTAGNINTLGTGSITIAGSGSTLTTQLTGLTNHAIQIGAGTATLTQLGAGTTGQVLQTNTGADPTWSTATYPSTTTVSQILYSSSTNTVGGLATANRGVLTTGATGIPVITALATDGQVIIGSTAGAPAAATITAGTGISVTNGSNSITIAATGGVAWVDVTGASQTIAVNTNYLSDRAGAVAFTLPASATRGDFFRIAGVQGSWTLAQAANQQIKFGSSATTVGATGSLASNDAGDCIECVSTNTSASTIWRVISSMGNVTVA